MMKSIYQQILSLVLFSILLLVSAFSYALPFIVVPKAGTSLPTTIAPGQTATAFYTVTNNTLRTLPGSFVKYLPLNVTQVTSPAIAPNLCGSTFNLVSGGSCTLGLTVSGAVNAADPDRHHHLFVCTAHVPACAGTDYPLNVISVPALISLAITPLNRLIAIGTKLQYTATGTYSNVFRYICCNDA
jgi:hypothetical protein